MGSPHSSDRRETRSGRAASHMSEDRRAGRSGREATTAGGWDTTAGSWGASPNLPTRAHARGPALTKFPMKISY